MKERIPIILVFLTMLIISCQGVNQIIKEEPPEEIVEVKPPEIIPIPREIVIKEAEVSQISETFRKSLGRDFYLKPLGREYITNSPYYVKLTPLSDQRDLLDDVKEIYLETPSRVANTAETREWDLERSFSLDPIFLIKNLNTLEAVALEVALESAKFTRDFNYRLFYFIPCNPYMILYEHKNPSRGHLSVKGDKKTFYNTIKTTIEGERNSVVPIIKKFDKLCSQGTFPRTTELLEEKKFVPTWLISNEENDIDIVTKFETEKILSDQYLLKKIEIKIINSGSIIKNPLLEITYIIDGIKRDGEKEWIETLAKNSKIERKFRPNYFYQDSLIEVRLYDNNYDNLVKRETLVVK